MVRVIEYICNKRYIWDTKMGRWQKVPERGERGAKVEKGEERKWEEEGLKDLQAPLQIREDLGWALWSWEKFANFKNWWVYLFGSCHLCGGWRKSPNNKGGSCDSRPLPSSLYTRQQRHMWSTTLRIQIYVPYMQRGLHWYQKTSKWPIGSGGDMVKYLPVKMDEHMKISIHIQA